MSKLTKSELSPSQIECIYYIICGMTAKQIAQKMGLSYRTIEGHSKAIRDKLDCANRSEIVSKVLGEDFLNEEIYPKVVSRQFLNALKNI